MNNILRILIVTLITLLVSCQQEEEQKQEISIQERLSLISTDSSFIYNQYLSDQRVTWKMSDLRSSENKSVRQYLEVATELLNSGRTDDGINLILELREIEEQIGITEEERQLTQTLFSVLYLRKGEQQNCIQLHNDQHCLFPIVGRGVYTVREETIESTRQFEIALENNPDDLVSGWLCNLAYMGLGWYPDSVPDKILIPNLGRDSVNHLPKFENLGPHIPIGALGSRGLAGGTCVDDFNNDGFLDVIVSSVSLTVPLKYYVNDGEGWFEELSQQAGLAGELGGLNLIHADYNNDGYLDVFVLRGGWFQKRTGEHPNSLLRNNGDNTFTNVTIESGLLSLKPTQTATWSDFNNDGWLDLFIGNETRNWDTVMYPCELFLNNGDGTFSDIAKAAGVDVIGFIKGVTSGDFNNDGLPDLYLSQFKGPNILFENTSVSSGEGISFKDVSKAAGVSEPLLSFPVWFWDYDNDGWEDLFVATYDYEGAPANIIREYMQEEVPELSYSFLYHNNGDGTFTNVASQVGLDKVLYTMGCNYGDLDNDGYLDFYAGTGAPDMRFVFPNRMFRNDKGSGFLEVTTSGGFGHVQKGHGIAFCDIDNDGDQDVYEVMGGFFAGAYFQNALFLNPGNDNNWIGLELEGTVTNTSAIGVRVAVTIQEGDTERKIYRTVSTGASFGGNPLQMHIGLGDAESIKEVQITWPTSGQVNTLNKVEPNRWYGIVEGDMQVTESKRKAIKFIKLH